MRHSEGGVKCETAAKDCDCMGVLKGCQGCQVHHARSIPSPHCAMQPQLVAIAAARTAKCAAQRRLVSGVKQLLGSAGGM